MTPISKLSPDAGGIKKSTQIFHWRSSTGDIPPYTGEFPQNGPFLEENAWIRQRQVAHRVRADPWGHNEKHLPTSCAYKMYFNFPQAVRHRQFWPIMAQNGLSSLILSPNRKLGTARGKIKLTRMTARVMLKNHLICHSGLRWHFWKSDYGGPIS